MLLQLAFAHTLSRCNPTLERKLHCENEPELVDGCAASNHHLRTSNPDGRWQPQWSSPEEPHSAPVAGAEYWRQPERPSPARRWI